MTGSGVFTLSPFIALSLAPVVVMLAIAARRNHAAIHAIAIGSLALSFCLAWFTSPDSPQQITPLVLVDGTGLFYVSLNIIATMLILMVSRSHLARGESRPEEFYILLLIANAGASILAVSTHFASFYLGLEVLSVSLYGLVAYSRLDKRGTEAGLKYLLLASASAAFLLFGMALVYAERGVMDFNTLSQVPLDREANNVVLLGIAMMLASVGFKLSIVPFHLWTADVYEGAPAPVTAFASTVAKIAMLSVLVRFLALQDAPLPQSFLTLIVAVAAASMIVGNLAALVQTNLKRLLAYSSIAHMGYLAVAFLAGGVVLTEAVAIYMAAYTAATIAAFGVIMALSTDGHDREQIENYRGLFWTNPLAAAVLAISMLSLAGIPLTAGFLAKFYVFAAGAQTAHWWLLVILALTSTVGLYYYLRIIIIMATRTDMTRDSIPPLASPGRDLALVTLSLVSLAIGVYPGPLIHLLQTLAGQ